MFPGAPSVFHQDAVERSATIAVGIGTLFGYLLSNASWSGLQPVPVILCSDWNPFQCMEEGNWT